MTEFIGLIGYPLGFVLIILSLIWYLRQPEQVAAYEKASFDRSHAYTKGTCCCGRDKTED